MGTPTSADTCSLNKVTVDVQQGFLLAYRTGQPYVVAATGKARVQMSSVWVCQCQGRASSFHQARCQSLSGCSWSHSPRERIPVPYVTHSRKTLANRKCFKQILYVCRHMCALVRLWKSVFQRSAHSFRLCGPYNLRSSAVRPSPLPSEPSPCTPRLHFFSFQN